MKKILLSFAAMLMLAVSISSCSSNSPKASADKFLTSFYHMDFETAKTMSTDDTKKMLDMMAQFSSMVPDSAKETAKKIKVNIKDVKEEGDNATVTYTASDPASGTDGTEQKLKMVKQSGKWLAQWSKQDGMGGEGAGQQAPVEEPMNTMPADTTMQQAAPADGTVVDTTMQ